MKAILKKEVIAKFAELKGQGATRAELADLLKKDESKPNAAEQKEILNGLFTEEPFEIPNGPGPGFTTAGNKAAQGTGSSKKTVGANATIAADLEKIDYHNLNGDNFKAYVELVGDRSYTIVKDGQELPVSGRLLENQEFDFVLLKAKPILQTRYVGVEGSPTDYVGIEITSDKPIHTSRMAVKQALEMNAQILNQHSRGGHGKYYLLKK